MTHLTLHLATIKDILKIIILAGLALCAITMAIISAILLKTWLTTIIVLSILKLAGIIYVPWFTNIFTLGAISTGLWMLVSGVILWIPPAIMAEVYEYMY